MENIYYLAENAVITGDVQLHADVNIWYGAVLRGDHGQILVGEGTNIQDLCILHEQTTIGRGCTIGHGAIVHGCTIGDGTTVGMGSILLTGAVIGKNCMVGAGALVTGKTVAPDGSLLLGSPAKVVRPLTPEELRSMQHNAEDYVSLAKRSLTPHF